MWLAVWFLETLMLKMTRPNFAAPFTSPNRTTKQNMIIAVTALRGGKNIVQLMSFKRAKTGLFKKKLRDGIL